ncbi:MAG: ribokinase [Chthonomonadales bacterium]|nr:ribokinase [Chthonomonadales bacterium]
MEHTPRVLVIGSANTDMVVRVPRIPSPGETVVGGDLAVVPGGKGANQAVAAARLGASVSFVGRVGNDVFGDTARSSLSSHGIDVTSLRTDSGASSGVALIAVAPDGQNSIVVAPGANMCVTPEDIDDVFRTRSDFSAVLIQCEVPISTVTHTINRCREFDLPVILNPAPACELETEALFGVRCLTPNAGEACALLGTTLTDDFDPVRAAIALMDLGPDMVVITLGADGAYAATHRNAIRVPAYSVEAVDATGAGDCFTAALTIALLDQDGSCPTPSDEAGLASALRFAAAAAALSVTRIGAQPSMPQRAEVLAFLEQI